MNRENKKIKYFEAFRYRWISEKIKEYEMYSTESLEEELKALLSAAIEDKDKTKETPLFILPCFFLIQAFIRDLINICLLQRMKVCI